ncbi:MAG TPA: hypothetical protein VKR32_13605 [Puia sp.]|nr:hypothetical protein [Puia sp.]
MLVSALLFAAALARGLSINNILIASKTGDISTSFSNSVFVNWVLSVVLLCLVAIWLLFLAGDLKRRKRRAWTQAILIGLFLTGFGIGMWFRFPTSWHLPGYSVAGLILVIPLLLYAGKFNE